MPEPLSSTVAEREAELAALQSAFDEYIASSRELEEELDAELAKMQEKLAESTAANAALSSQLENIGPQLTSLETALTETRAKVKQEQRLRRAAEQGQDEAEQRLRENEVAMQTLREENDALHEEVAFKESELEEMKLELDVEREQLQSELAKARSGAATTNGSAQVASAAEREPAPGDTNDEYVKKLEEELELVTEQLIETEKRLGETEALLEDARGKNVQLSSVASREEDTDMIEKLLGETTDLQNEKKRLQEDLDITKEELTLAKEENALLQDEYQAIEADYKTVQTELEEERVKHREKVNELQIQLKEAEISSRNTIGNAAAVVSTVQSTTKENDKLQEEIRALEQALTNAQEDYKGVIEELEAVNARFDEVREEARREGREAAADELREAMKADVSHEVEQLQEKLNTLSQENRLLQGQVDETEMKVAELRDAQDPSKSSGAESQVAKHLQSQLDRAKEDLAAKDAELEEVKAALEERLTRAEGSISKLEHELSSAKGNLAEAEAKIIVLRREKDSREYVPKSPQRERATADGDGAPAMPDLVDEIAPEQESLEDIQNQLAAEKTKYAELEKEYDALLDQKRIGEVRIKRLEEDLRTLQKEVFAQGAGAVVGTQMTRLSSLASPRAGAADIIGDDDDRSKKIQQAIESKDVRTISEELSSLEKRFNAQKDYNAQLLSKMLELQGNIQVYCRVRPLSVGEIQKNNKVVVEALGESEVGCFDDRTNKWKSFIFDRVWGPDQSQQSVFQDVEPLALSVVDGFNACIFAYGQTGSGKTYTMEGSAANNQYGISYRTIQKIFHLLKLRAQQQRAADMFVASEGEEAHEVDFTYNLEVGMLEIYNDEVYDLLGTEGKTLAEKQQQAMNAGGKGSLEIRRNAEGRIEVPNLKKEKVHNIEEVMALLKRGNSNRATASTDMNEHSSRSHMVLSVDVHSGLDGHETNKGTLFLVDLAGSERVRKSNVGGDQLKEAGFINRSLSALGNVMEALDRKASHVPYRDSKLTYLLQDSIGGNSRTMMVVNINPADASFDESIHALQFATRVRRIQLGAAQRNVTSKNLEETVKKLTDEMKSVTRAKERTESQLMSLKRDNARVQDKLTNLSKTKQQNRTDTKTLEMLRKNNDDMANRWQKEKAAREEQAEEIEKLNKELREIHQQLGKSKSQMKQLETKLEERERDLAVANKQLRQSKVADSASAIRSRQAQALGKTPVAATPRIPSSPGSTDVGEIRSKVLALLEKHDQSKVDRVDVIMDKFKGKEAMLLEKLTQRYEGSSSSVAGSTSSVSFQKRNEMALQRHQERMKKIREQQNSK